MCGAESRGEEHRLLHVQLSHMLQLLFRDYPQPLLSQSDVSMRGRSILAEEEAIARATRNIVIRLDPPWSNVTVVKRLAALKLYHDWDWRERPVCIAQRCCSSAGPLFVLQAARSPLGAGALALNLYWPRSTFHWVRVCGACVSGEGVWCMRVG